MSFLFGKKSKQQGNPLPPATRDITSSSGPGPQVASLNGPPREKDGPRPGPQPQSNTSTPSGSVNNSLSSLQGRDGQPLVPEPKALRERAGSNEQVRAVLGTTALCALHFARMLTIDIRAHCRMPGLRALQGLQGLPRNHPTRGLLAA